LVREQLDRAIAYNNCWFATAPADRLMLCAVCCVFSGPVLVSA
jgi:hypothetical protein